MGIPMVLVVTMCYLIAAADCYMQNKIGLGVQFFMYALANSGAILILKGY